MPQYREGDNTVVYTSRANHRMWPCLYYIPGFSRHTHIEHRESINSQSAPSSSAHLVGLMLHPQGGTETAPLPVGVAIPGVPAGWKVGV